MGLCETLPGRSSHHRKSSRRQCQVPEKLPPSALSSFPMLDVNPFPRPSFSLAATTPFLRAATDHNGTATAALGCLCFFSDDDNSKRRPHQRLPVSSLAARGSDELVVAVREEEGGSLLPSVDREGRRVKSRSFFLVCGWK